MKVRARNVARLLRALTVVCVILCLHGSTSSSQPTQRRVIVLGFDGLDPGLAEKWMQNGTLPHLARVAALGGYQTLPTTNPAQSPVAWSSFATGLHPGDHGVFDFVARDPASYALESGIANEKQPESVVIFGIRLPLDYPQTINRRSGTPFWITSERHGHRSSVFRVPVTYPPDPIHRMLSGMGVPDVLGTQGTFTFYTTDVKDDRPGAGGRVVVLPARDDMISTVLEGPPHPLHFDAHPLTVPLVLSRAAGSAVKVSLDGHDVVLVPRQWSDWVGVSFPFWGLLKVKAIVRLYLVQGFPAPRLYISPIQLDPREAGSRISSPPGFASELAARIGPFHTAGMAEETWSLNEERIDDRAYLDMVKTVLAEREAMLFDALARNDSALIITVFEQTDRVSHMFWRGIDPDHLRFIDAGEDARGAIRWIYGEADRIVGRTLDAMRAGDRLIILSDHGFAPFRRSVHLNRWLAEVGLLTVQRGSDGIDWARTKAYAIGLNGIFINRKGREAQGAVTPEEIPEIKRRIMQELTQLRDPRSDAPMVLSVKDADEIYRGIHRDEAPDLVIGYARGYRASWETALGAAPRQVVEDNASKWSGDHLVEPSQVPGVLFTSFKTAPVPSIADMSKLVAEALGMTIGSPQDSGGSGGREATPPAPPVIPAVDLPLPLKLAVLAALAAALSTGLYGLLINRSRLAALRSASTAARRELLSADATAAGVAALIGKNYRLTAMQLWLVGVPAAVAAVPAVLMTIWIANTHDFKFPSPGERIGIEIVPAKGHRAPVVGWRGGEAVYESGRWRVAWPQPGRTTQLVNHDGTVLVTLPLATPVDEIRQISWWSNVFGEPVGHLPTPGDVEAVRLDLPAQTLVEFGPPWLWQPSVVFLILLAGFSAAMHWCGERIRTISSSTR
jgi:predicted AlkP superfamily phosphohydrolase/phosphomutase